MPSFDELMAAGAQPIDEPSASARAPKQRMSLDELTAAGAVPADTLKGPHTQELADHEQATKDRLAALPSVVELNKIAVVKPPHVTPPTQHVLPHAGPTDAQVVSGLRSFVAGASGNLMDEGAAGLEAFGEHPIEAVKAALPGTAPDNKFLEAYHKHHKEYQDAYEQAAKDNPGLNLVGSLAMPIPGAGKLKGLAKVAAMAGTAAGVSGLSSFGASHKSGLDAAQEAVPAATTGAVLGGGLGAASVTAEKLIPWLKSVAATRALKAAGAQTPDIARLREKGIMDRVGQDLLDRKVITPMAGPEQVFNRVTKNRAVDSSDIGKAIDTLTATGKTIDTRPAANKLMGSVVNPLLASNPDDQRLAGRLFQHVDELNNRPNQSFRQAQDYKQGLDKYIKHDSLEGQPYREGLRNIRQGLNAEIKTAAQAADPAVAASLEDANTRFGNSNEQLKFVQKALNKDIGLRKISPSDYMVGGAAGAGGIAALGPVLGPLVGLGAGAANHVLRRNGSSIAATSANRLVQGAGKLSDVDGALLARWLASRQGTKTTEPAASTEDTPARRAIRKLSHKDGT